MLTVIRHIEELIAIIVISVFLCNLSEYTARAAVHDDIVGDVTRHNAARTNHHIATDGHAGIDDDVAAQPDIVANGNADAILISGITGVRVNRMPRRID